MEQQKQTPRGRSRSQARPTRRATPRAQTAAPAPRGSAGASSRVSADAAPRVAPKATSSSRRPSRRGDAKAWRPSYRSLAFFVVIAALGIGYLVGLIHFSSHFAPATTIAGVDVSGMSVEEAGERLEKRVSSYQDHVSGEGLDFVVRSGDVGLKLDGQAYAAAAIKHASPALWPLELFIPHTYEGDEGVSYDQTRLQAMVDRVINTYNGRSDTFEGGSVVYDEETGRYVSTSDMANAMLSSDAVMAAVGTDLSSLRAQTIIDASALMLPKLDEGDAKLSDAAEQANQMLALTIPLTVEGKKVMQIDSALISRWVNVVDGSDGPEVVVYPDAITAWASENLGQVVDGESETRSWEVDPSATGEAIAARIKALDNRPVECPTITIEERPAETEGAAQRGRHIDVNITTQYARLYDEDGTVLWRSYVVTGDPRQDNETPVGEFEIINMEENVTLTGPDEDGDGEGDYESFVAYWMCFKGATYGLHDATWREEADFGKGAGEVTGSHGCVNLPLQKAAELYALVRLGDPVYIHY